MENLQSPVTKPEIKGNTTEKLPYEPPKITFVPLKLEERLACSKASHMTCSASSLQSK